MIRAANWRLRRGLVIVEVLILTGLNIEQVVRRFFLPGPFQPGAILYLVAGLVILTMESIAARARTSEAVLYRRWANKDRLVLAAIEHHRNANPVALPDTGTLRGDLLAYLTTVSEARAAV